MRYEVKVRWRDAAGDDHERGFVCSSGSYSAFLRETGRVTTTAERFASELDSPEPPRLVYGDDPVEYPLLDGASPTEHEEGVEA